MGRSNLSTFRRPYALQRATPGRRARGQSLVELAFSMPILLVLTIGVFEIGRAAHAYIAVTHGARDGARWAMDPEKSDGEVVSHATNATGRLKDHVSVSFPGGRSPQGRASVRVTYPFTTEVPLISNLWGGGALNIRRTMVSEGDAL